MTHDEHREEFLRREQELDADNRKRWALTILTCCLVFAASMILRHPWDVVLAGFISIWVLVGLLIMLWPGHCPVCGTRTSNAGPRRGAPRRAWWDFRPPARSSMVFVCPHHVPMFILASAHPQEES